LESVEHALAVYVDTVKFGLQCALLVLDAIGDDKMLPPKPASGQLLKIGEQVLDGCMFCASPIPRANAFAHLGPDKTWVVTQGELFAGTLNLGGMLDDDDGDCVNFLGYTQDNANVLVKVSSRTVHFLLIDPKEAYAALEEMYLTNAASNAGRKMSPEKRRVMKSRAELLKEISSVLYAAVKTSAGMLTVMSDLSEQGFTTLSAEDHSDKLSVLWKGFQDLVNKVLLPMASMSIVHADIRPGFDETSNILCKFETKVTGEITASLKLIDYESVVKVLDWHAPEYGCYIKRETEKWKATTFVWWQCLAVAYAWKSRRTAESFFEDKVSNLVSRLKNELRRGGKKGAMPLLPLHYIQYMGANEISQETVTQTLAELANHFV
jgi:hypothetical protein